MHVAELLKDNPSLRRLINQFIAEELSAGRELAEISLAEHSETPTVDLATLAYTSEQVVGKWLPRRLTVPERIVHWLSG